MNILAIGAHPDDIEFMCAGTLALLRERGLRPAGIIAEGLWDGGVRSGFDLVDLSTGEKARLCRREPGGEVRAGEFRFFQEGLDAGRAAFSREKLSGAAAVFLDEAGFLELEGGGWAPQLEALLGESGPPSVLVVRDYLLEKVLARWRIKPAAVWKAGLARPAEALAALAALTSGR